MLRGIFRSKQESFLYDSKDGCLCKYLTLADNLIPALRQQISLVKQSANKTIGWQYLFPSTRLSKDPESKLMRRHHIDESSVQRAVRDAARKAKIDKTVTPAHASPFFKKCVPAFFPTGHPSDVQI